MKSADGSSSPRSELDPALVAHLQELRARWGQETLVRLAEMFSQQGERIEELRRAVDGADDAAVAEIAHFLKGAARALHAERLAEICSQLELRGSDDGGAMRLVDALGREWDLACEVFRPFL